MQITYYIDGSEVTKLAHAKFVSERADNALMSARATVRIELDNTEAHALHDVVSFVAVEGINGDDGSEPLCSELDWALIGTTPTGYSEVEAYDFD